MFDFFEKKKKNGIEDKENIFRFNINLEEIEKQMDTLMKDMMSSQSMQSGKPNFFSVSIKVDKNGNKTIRTMDGSQANVQKSRVMPNKTTDVNEPLADIHDLGDKLSIIADMQGMTEKDVKINVENDSLIAINANDGTRTFSKNVELPADIDKKSLRTSFKNGILEITLNKKK
ncbi:MAG: Hsp20/alpha crystallin family protein [archaeon]